MGQVRFELEQTASYHHGWTVQPWRYFSLIIQTSVTPFLASIPVSLIFFLFINFFHFPNSRDVTWGGPHIKNPWLVYTISCWLPPPSHLPSLTKAPRRVFVSASLTTYWQLAGWDIFSLINYCCFVCFVWREQRGQWGLYSLVQSDSLISRVSWW